MSQEIPTDDSGTNTSCCKRSWIGIGDFRFRVKTWCVGVFTGFLVAGAAANGHGVTYLLSLTVILAFWLLEQYHVHWQQALTRRAATLERSLQQQFKSTMVSESTDEATVESSPGIVDAIIAADNELRKGGRFAWAVRHANGIFYLILAFVAIVLMCLTICDETREDISC